MMENLNAEAVKKALECCYSNRACDGCPYSALVDCRRELERNTIALIKELTEENERLSAENANYEAENHAEFNKWLKLEEATKRHHAELFEEAKIAVKADTVRKMAESIKLEFYREFDEIIPSIMADRIDQIAKEMLEEEK